MKSAVQFALASVSLLALAQPAMAQDERATSGGDPDSEIVVTGTLIRGVAATGANTIGVSQEKVEETGASTVSQLLQTIPQFGSFNNFQTPIGGGNFQTTNRPNLRNLPGFTTTGSSATLMLVDGHRVVGMGISSTSPDADLVPPGVIERVEIIPDGGSAIYGSDAVAGVINFITRKDINGVEVDARYGFADDYYSFDANATVGKTWDGGGVYASYNYSEHDDILGRDRDWVRTYPANRGFAQAVTEVECPGGNVNVRGSADVYGLPFTTANAATKRNVINQCDLSDTVSIYPKENRHSVFAGLNQQLSDALKFDMRAYYMRREMYQSLGPYHGTLLLSSLPGIGLPTSPYLAAHKLTSSFVELQNVYFAFGEGNASHQNVKVEAWGVVPTFTYDLGGSWQARLMGSYGESDSLQHSTRMNTSAPALASPSGLFNPYDPNASASGVLAAMTNWETYGHTRQDQFDARLVLDGDLFQLPGGAVKLAAGLEYLKEHFIAQRGDTVPGAQNTGSPGVFVGNTMIIAPTAALPVNKLGRDVKAAFGELVVPIFGADNATGGFQELTLSASGRYDDYSDFGDTFNPKLGITWKPMDWVKLRAAWGKSFAAPSLADNSAADPVGLNWASGGTFNFLVPTSVVVANGYPAPTAAQNTAIVLLGGKPDLEPQTATTWSAGIDLDPTFVPGLHLSLTYYNIKYNDLIALPPFTTTSTYFSTFGNSFIINPTQAQIDTAIAGAATIVGSPCAPTPSCVYIIEDNRKQNLGRFKLSGLDFSANYATATNWGGIDFNVGGSYELNREQSATATSAYVDLLEANTSRLKLRSSLGTDIGNFRAQVTWNHSQGYDLNPSVPAAGGFPQQDRVGSFNVFDLYFKYDVAGEGAFSDLTFTVNVNNVFDEDPPVWRAQQITLNSMGYANGATVGRFIQFGVSKKF